MNETLSQFIAEIQYIIDNHTAPLAPTKQRYKRLKRKGTPGLKSLKKAGYGDTSKAWAQLIQDHFGIEVETREQAISRGQTIRYQMSSLFNDDAFWLQTWDEPESYTEFDKYPPPGMPVCRVREDAYRIYYLLQ